MRIDKLRDAALALRPRQRANLAYIRSDRGLCQQRAQRVDIEVAPETPKNTVRRRTG
jgi:hypothetical protein